MNHGAGFGVDGFPGVEVDGEGGVGRAVEAPPVSGGTGRGRP